MLSSRVGSASGAVGRLRMARLRTRLFAHAKYPHLSLYERCGVHFPELPRRFLIRRASADCSRHRTKLTHPLPAAVRRSCRAATIGAGLTTHIVTIN